LHLTIQDFECKEIKEHNQVYLFITIKSFTPNLYIRQTIK
jgi:hypothetical protein